ncbi:DUF1579 domain-containing protein [Pseudoalteromonas sp. MSK9-3]|uniref:DUF1579 domain-containing protein n=1 Tax=Pseudoalteromonas sp. MSK9-3 TaxID=1897633 RepID=UPI000E6C073F|nr:DUF1579 domain-containing protein [Pseudoalteromonas sp. MSK9-3]RJE71229.1 DUF1579 domain-containing protein [Pseudoalteromonas sp. MSK9-3]
MLTNYECNTPKDFDFIIGDWSVKHRRLTCFLTECDEWIEFTGTSSVQKTLGGFGNIEDVQLQLPTSPYRAIALRSYDSMSQNWSIWWLDGRSPNTLDVPVVGQFKQGIGEFFADEVIKGVPVKVRFTWFSTNPNTPRWEQAFSKDNGATWQTNWIMTFAKRM